MRSVGLDLPLELFGGSLVTSSRAVPMLVALALGAAGTGFLAAAFMVVGWEPKVGPLLMAVATLSLVTTVVGLWGTAGGALVNLAVPAAVSGAPRLVDTQEPKAF